MVVNADSLESYACLLHTTDHLAGLGAAGTVLIVAKPRYTMLFRSYLPKHSK